MTYFQHYHIRLTLTLEKEQIRAFCDLLGKRYLFSSEVTHFHIYMYTNFDKIQITDKVKTTFEVKGNKFFSVQIAKDSKQLQKYVLKDGNYEYKGFTETEITQLFKSSFKKGKDKFMIESEQLEEQYLSSGGFERFAIKYIQLKVRYNQNINMTQMKSYFYKMQVRRDPEYARIILSQLNL